YWIFNRKRSFSAEASTRLHPGSVTGTTSHALGRHPGSAERRRPRSRAIRGALTSGKRWIPGWAKLSPRSGRPPGASKSRQEVLVRLIAPPLLLATSDRKHPRPRKKIARRFV